MWRDARTQAHLAELRDLTEPPRIVGIVARSLLVVAFIGLILAALVPWRQSATGSGAVVAWDPQNRPIPIEAAIDGQVSEWKVREGDKVKAGDVLGVLVDNDPDRVSRLALQQTAAQDGTAAAVNAIAFALDKVEAAERSRDRKASEYDAKLAGLRQKRVADAAAAETARLQADRVVALQDAGVESARSAELAVLSAAKAEAALQARDAEIRAVSHARAMEMADAESKIASARSSVASAEQKAATARSKQADSDSKVARQAAQNLVAPRDGTVVAVYAERGGQVKKGDPLFLVLPDAAERSVELTIDGNDAAFVRLGDEVRLLFEGFPALQVVGLPGAHVGTFEGEVVWIAPIGTDSGDFRVLVSPAQDEPWPESDLLRQGTRAKGFVLMQEVTVGYEIWRQVNGFPPLPKVDSGSKPSLPTNKKPRAPSGLKG